MSEVVESRKLKVNPSSTPAASKCSTTKSTTPRRNKLATKNSLRSLRLQLYIYSPVRFTPAIGVMSGAHYRTLIMFFTSPHHNTLCWGPRNHLVHRKLSSICQRNKGQSTKRDLLGTIQGKRLSGGL